MGFLDQVAGVLDKLSEQRGDAQQGALMGSVLGLIDRAGGFTGLLGKLRESGLDQQVGSWVGIGNNQEVSGEQITQAVGQDTIAELARKAGIDPENAASGLASLLPQVIDQLTPEGRVPKEELLQKGLELLKNKYLS